MGLKTDHCSPPNINIVNKTQHIDTSHNEPSRDLLTVDRALNVSILNINHEVQVAN